MSVDKFRSIVAFFLELRLPARLNQLATALRLSHTPFDSAECVHGFASFFPTKNNKIEYGRNETKDPHASRVSLSYRNSVA